MKTTVYLIRHGVTDWNEQGKYQGRSDIPLNARGREEAKKVGLELANIPFNALYSSPLSRAHETAREIAKHHNLPILLHDALQERSYGEYEGKTFQEIEKDPYFQQHLRENWYLRGAPKGETFEEAAKRVGLAIDTIISDHVNETIGIVAHGGVIKGIGYHIGHLEKEHVAKIIIHNAKPIQLEYFHDEKRYNVINFPVNKRK